MTSSRLWVTWEYQPRNRSMAKHVGASCSEFVVNSNRLFRYILCTWQTFDLVRKKKPNLLFVQNPSLVLSVVTLLARPIFKYRLVIDQHNSGIFPFEGRSTFLNSLAKLIFKFADLNIVSNGALKSIIEQKGGRCVIAPDPLPDLSNNIKDCSIRLSSAELNILFICSWEGDEAYAEVIESLNYVKTKNVKVYATGNFHKALSPIQLKNLPKTFIPTGYISYVDYCSLLNSVDGVIVLTKRSSCLNCGIYEAISLGKPGIITDDEELAGYFSRGFLYTKIDSRKIAENIDIFADQNIRLKNEVSRLRDNLSVSYGKFMDKLEAAFVELE